MEFVVDGLSTSRSLVSGRVITVGDFEIDFLFHLYIPNDLTIVLWLEPGGSFHEAHSWSTCSTVARSHRGYGPGLSTEAVSAGSQHCTGKRHVRRVVTCSSSSSSG